MTKMLIDAKEKLDLILIDFVAKATSTYNSRDLFCVYAFTQQSLERNILNTVTQPFFLTQKLQLHT